MTKQPDDHDRHFRRYLDRPRRGRLARVVEAYYRFVWDTALRVTGNAADAADVTQDVFLKLLLEPPRADRVTSPRGYLAWEVVGRATNLRRAVERRKARERAAAELVREDGLDPAHLDDLRARIAELPEELRTAVELRYFAGLKNAEIAALTGVGERHVEKRLERAREILRTKMGSTPALLIFLDRDGPGGILAGTPAEPPASLRMDLLKIASHGSALVVPAVKVCVAAGGAGMAKKSALMAAAILLFLGGTTAVVVRLRNGSENRSPAIATRLAPAPEPVTGGPPETATIAASPAKEAESSDGAPYISVRGAITNEEGERIAGARVTLAAVISEEDAVKLREQGFQDAAAGRIDREATTGDDGEYTFDQVYPVKVVINVEKSPYLPTYMWRTRIRPREERKFDLILCHPLRLYGTVRTPEGDPAKDAQVFISFDYAKHYYPDPTDDEFAPAQDHPFPVDAEGKFDTGFGLVNTRHFCALPGYVLAPGREMKDFYISCKDFKEREKCLDLVLAPERRLTVFVRESSGSPVPEAMVEASNLSIHKVLTDDAGRAALDRLPSKSFTLSVSKDGYQEESVSAETLASSEVEVVLKPPSPGIEGRVTFDDALPAASRRLSDVYFYELGKDDKPIRAIHGISHDKDEGTFFCRPKGPLRFEALCILGWRTLTQKPLSYDGRNKLTVDFHVRLEPPYISGRVLRADTREPVAGIPVTLRLPWREAEPFWSNCRILNGFPFPVLPLNSAKTTSSAEGSFLFLLSETDRYRSESPLPAHAILTAGSEEAGYSADRSFDLDIHPHTVVKDVELELEGVGAIDGRVIDAAGQPLVGGIVVAYDGSIVVKHAKTDTTGSYRIEGLRPGRYLIEFVGRAPYPRESSGSGGMDAEQLPRPSEFYDFPIRVKAGETSRWDVDLRTDALGAIDGLVLPELKGATGVECGLLAGGRPRGGLALRRSEQLGEGRFQLEQLLPGTYRVWLLGEGEGRLSEMDVAVKRGARTSIVMPVPTGSLAIPLEGAGAQQVPEAKVVELVRWESYARDGRRVWTEIAAANVTVVEGSLRLEGLVTGSVQATIFLPGFHATRSEPTWVEQGRASMAPPVVLIPGGLVHLRLGLPEGSTLAREPSIRVIDQRTEAGVFVSTARKGEGLVWDLSGLPVGDLTIRVHAGGAFREAQADVTIGPQAEKDVSVELQPAGPN